ncbi:glycine zipper domain-containing protein [Teredinibacter franksiae]|uniref:glycine zipper domain-containing protein n=1 Tax=Teredinibacter franksiae TaxID=2761453 RepID=UPI001626D613|nr:glycine zipper domain-containing protein [Teredinibacter franksiae]
MSDKLLKNKEVGITTLIGAGLGAAQGAKTNKLVPNALLGAGIGALVGVFGTQLFSTKEKQPEESEAEQK